MQAFSHSAATELRCYMQHCALWPQHTQPLRACAIAGLAIPFPPLQAKQLAMARGFVDDRPNGREEAEEASDDDESEDEGEEEDDDMMGGSSDEGAAGDGGAGVGDGGD